MDVAQQRWVKPHFRTIKVNCDGAWCKRTNRGGIGWVARDFAGIFQCAGGFERVQLEIDSKVLVKMLNGVLVSEASMEGILWDILHLRQQVCSVEFLFSPHACNEVAHHVASFAMRMEGNNCGLALSRTGCSIFWRRM
ncbi:uncharacterized protein LOC126609172 [Malus sylvestris]|uniref:uncharacterized protein LOC126609172 n=1 Tax=Malus sylvestris TaxID=3752 RepID=UPI0021ACB355|nr:uncharacterized protein LOC126609172 [Malus sylvestris]